MERLLVLAYRAGWALVRALPERVAARLFRARRRPGLAPAGQGRPAAAVQPRPGGRPTGTESRPARPRRAALVRPLLAGVLPAAGAVARTHRRADAHPRGAQPARRPRRGQGHDPRPAAHGQLGPRRRLAGAHRRAVHDRRRAAQAGRDVSTCSSPSARGSGFEVLAASGGERPPFEVLDRPAAGRRDALPAGRPRPHPERGSGDVLRRPRDDARRSGGAGAAYRRRADPDDALVLRRRRHGCLGGAYRGADPAHRRRRP